MGQVTIYLDNQIENKMKTAVKTSHLSVSKWIAKLIKDDELVKRSKQDGLGKTFIFEARKFIIFSAY